MSNTDQAIMSSDKVINEKTIEKKQYKPDVKNILMLFADYIAVIAAYIISVLSVCNVGIEILSVTFLNAIIRFTPFYAIFVAAIFYVFKLYLPSYKEVGVNETRRLLISNFFTILIYAVIMTLAVSDIPSTFFLIGGMLQYFFTAGLRFFYSLVHVSETEKSE